MESRLSLVVGSLDLEKGCWKLLVENLLESKLEMKRRDLRWVLLWSGFQDLVYLALRWWGSPKGLQFFSNLQWWGQQYLVIKLLEAKRLE